MKIFESVPNVSEGRDIKKIKLLIQEIKSVENLRLLDSSSDPDHNRSVFTFIGTAEAVLEANFKLAAKAKELLDIRQHAGVHPRLGIVDVIPIIPVWQAKMSEAVKISHELGEKIQKELGIPVCYYEFAAKDKKYQNLADIRRKSYNIAGHPTAGAVCIGARNYLVAYNINLETDDLAEAKNIAARIREAGGGLRGVKALGVRLGSKKCVQVSMNLTAPETTPPEVVYHRVEELAKGAGVKIKEEELIGILPLQVIREAQQLSAEVDQKIELLRKTEIYSTEIEGQISDADDQND